MARTATNKRTEMTTLNVRNIDVTIAAFITTSAKARGWTIAEYLGKIARLHHVARTIADAGRCEQLRSELEKLELQTVQL